MKSDSKTYIPTEAEMQAIREDMLLSSILRDPMVKGALCRLCEAIARNEDVASRPATIEAIIEDWAKAKR